MNALVNAIYARLSGDASLTALLAVYGSSPAIFSGDLVPEDATTPYIWISGAVAEIPWDTKTTRGRETVLDLNIYASPGSSQIQIEGISERVRKLLHRLPLTVSGQSNVIVKAGGPIQLPQEERVVGRGISLLLITQEN